jgi:small subunit ribosomal protein S8
MMTDPIAEMLTRMRNANRIYRVQVNVPYSQLKENILKKFQQEGFIKGYKKVDEKPQALITVYLKYGPDGEHVIREIHRVSKPGRRVYKNLATLGMVLNGLGVAIVSTPKGILTDRECHLQKIGGEVLCMVW